MRSLLLISLLSCLPASLFSASAIAGSQSFALPAKDLLSEANQNLDKNADVTVLLEDTHWTYRADGSVESVARLVFQVRTADAISGWSSVEQHWEPWHEKRPVIHARVITPDGAAHELDQKTIVDAPAGESEADTYSDSRVVKCPLPAVQPGSVIEQEIRMEYQPILQAEVTRYYFGRFVPVRLSRLSVDYPEKLPFQYSTYSLPDAKITRTTEADIVHLTIENGPAEPLDDVLAMLPFDAQRWPNVTFSTGESWAALARAYNDLIEKQIAGAPVKETVAKLTSGTGDRNATIAALVRALHQQVRYTGVEFGDAAITPAKPEDTLKRRYGDCKDKAALLVTMLRAAGIPSHLALLSSGTAQDVDPKHPGFGLFDHAIVYVPGTPDAWIDATADTMQFGSLPSGDQGRLALVIAQETTGLTLIPDSPSKSNLTRETREFLLPDYGKVKVIETTEGEGNADASLRSNYGFAEREQMAKNLLSYMRNTYVSEAKIKIEHSNRDDYSRPFKLKLEIPEARRAFVGELDADLYIPLGDLFADLPPYFKTEDEKNPDPKEAIRRLDRKEAFVLPQAGINEWHYRISLPPGEQVKKFPDNETLEWGGAKYSAAFKSSEGIVSADFRFDTGKRRFSVEEAAQLKAGVLALLKRPVLSISFQSQGEALLRAGKVKEAIAAFSAMTRQYPKAPVYRVQLSLALLQAGCGNQSHAEALKATEVGPDSLLAWRNLGFASLNDAIGRQFQAGWDAKGAEAALRKALTIDPKDEVARRNLAVALEYDADGQRYVDKQRLASAIEVLEARTDEQLSEQGLLDDLLIDLAYAGRFQILLHKLDALPVTPTRLALRLDVMAETQSAQAALDEIAKRTSDDSVRHTALQLASEILIRHGQYSAAGELMAAGAQGSQDGGQLAARANIISKLEHVDAASLKPDTPENAVRLFSLALLSGKVEPRELLSEDALATRPIEKWREALEAESRGARYTTRSSSLPPAFMSDFMMYFLQLKTEENGDGGARVHLQQNGTSEWTYVMREKNAYRILGENKDMTGIGRRVLTDIKSGDMVSARKWLDWVRDEIKVEGGDDPLAGPAFPRIWTKSSPSDPALMTYAAASLLERAEVLPTLQTAIDSTTDKAAKAYAQLTFVRTSLYEHRWEQAESVAKELLTSYPDSDTGLLSLYGAYVGQHKWTAAEELLRNRLKIDLSDVAASRLLVAALSSAGSFAEAAEIGLKTAESPEGTLGDWNNYGWASLLAGNVTPETIQRVQKAANPNTQDAAFLHTLASMYAEAGDPAQARQLVLHTMDAWKLAEPNGQCWYVFGRIAEQYGVTEAALSYYEKVSSSKPEGDDPSSTYALAQRRIGFLKEQTQKTQMTAR